MNSDGIELISSESKSEDKESSVRVDVEDVIDTDIPLDRLNLAPSEGVDEDAEQFTFDDDDVSSIASCKSTSSQAFSQVFYRRTECKSLVEAVPTCRPPVRRKKLKKKSKFASKFYPQLETVPELRTVAFELPGWLQYVIPPLSSEDDAFESRNDKNKNSYSGEKKSSRKLNIEAEEEKADEGGRKRQESRFPDDDEPTVVRNELFASTMNFTAMEAAAGDPSALAAMEAAERASNVSYAKRPPRRALAPIKSPTKNQQMPQLQVTVQTPPRRMKSHRPRPQNVLDDLSQLSDTTNEKLTVSTRNESPPLVSSSVAVSSVVSLHDAYSTWMLQQLSPLIDLPADVIWILPSCPSYNDYTYDAAVAAIESGRVPCTPPKVKRASLTKPASIKSEEASAASILSALLSKDISKLKLLLESESHKQWPLAMEATVRCTLLMLATQQGWKKGTKLLIRKGANLDAQNKFGNTALHFAIEFGHEEIAQYLKKKGASVTLRNSLGMSCGDRPEPQELFTLSPSKYK